jgi:Uma2 family endonuclease
METERHRDQMLLLIYSLRDAMADRDDVYVSGNMFVYYSQTQAKKNDFRGPDVFVVLDTQKHERKSWVVWEEDGRTPDIVIEITSPSTEATDRGEKMRIYARLLRVSAYYIYDPFSQQLDGYLLSGREYQPLLPDEAGHLPCPPLGLSLGVFPGRVDLTRSEVTPWLRWVDAEGRVIPHPGELAHAAIEHAEGETRRAEAETRRAEAEAQRATALEARLAAYEKSFGPLLK